MAVLAAPGPVLIHFIDFAQLNSVRTLPYLKEWDRRYRDLGLSTVIVQAPRLPFAADLQATEAAVERLGLEMPVVIDSKRELWQDYGCEGWPSLFLWAQGGALRWVHFGEGEYQGTEEAIQTELRELDALRPLPALMAPLRATDEPGARVIPPTPELFPARDRAWTAEQDDPTIIVEYEGAGAHVTMEGQGRLHVKVDDSPLLPIDVPGPGLYTLTEHAEHGRHMVEVRLEGDLALWSFSFSPGLASV